MKAHLIGISLFFVLNGCATYQSRVLPAREKIVSGQCEAGLKLLSDLSEKEDGDQLVHLMEYGTALQICKDYKKSNSIFLKADKLSEQIDYHSITRITGAALLNEEMIQYKGDTFEKLFINASAALNYLQLGQLDESLVEVRRINEKFNKLNSDSKKKFELNSFSQYLAGLVYEMDQKYDDACISYKTAYKIDTSYRGIALDMLHACWLARRNNDFEILSKEVSPTDEELHMIKNKSKNETIILFMQGWGPRKTARIGNYAFPELVPVSSQTQALEIDSDSTKYISQPIYSVEKAAIETLKDDYASLVARRVGARVAKEVVADQIRQKDKALGEIARLVMLASEKADLRQWTMLPQTFQIIRLNGEVNSSKIKIIGIDRNKQVTENFDFVDLGSESKKKKIILLRSLK